MWARVQNARAVGAELAIPAITIASDPGVHSQREEMNARNEQYPGHQPEARQPAANVRPAVHAGVDAAGGIYRLHEAQGFFTVDLRKAGRDGRIVKINEFDAAEFISAPDAGGAGAAQAARTIIENS